jgi:PBP1b-binding outer membrane lipoprotein LpoB
MLRSLFLVLALGACSKKAKYVDPDVEARVEGTGIESRDIRAVVAEMSKQLLANPAIADAKSAPRIAVLPIDNRSRFLIDSDILNTLITDGLINGAAGKLAIVNRDLTDQIVAERQAKARGQVDGGAPTASMAGVEYFLEGEISSLSASTTRAQTDYVVIRFQLTDASTGIVGWSNSWDMKKEGSWGVMYQ